MKVQGSAYPERIWIRNKELGYVNVTLRDNVEEKPKSKKKAIAIEDLEEAKEEAEEEIKEEEIEEKPKSKKKAIAIEDLEEAKEEAEEEIKEEEIEEKQIEHDETTDTIYEYDEVTIKIVDRPNLEEYINTYFDALFEMGLQQETTPPLPTEEERLQAIEDAVLFLSLGGI